MGGAAGPGDEVTLAPPFPTTSARSFCAAASGFVEQKESEDFILDARRRTRRHPQKTKAILRNSPSNPLGTSSPQARVSIAAVRQNTTLRHQARSIRTITTVEADR
jgi:aspartate/methionine/tyrosine aminotransferase